MAEQRKRATKSKKGRKYNRNRIGRSASNQTRYRAEGRREKNKKRRIAKLMRRFPKYRATPSE